MYLLLILPTLVSGFLACHIHPENKAKLHRYQGQYLYLKSAEMGLKCFGIALVIGFLTHLVIPDTGKIYTFEFSLQLAPYMADKLAEMGVKTDDALLLAWVVILSLLTFFSAYILQGIACIRLIHKYGADKVGVGVTGAVLEDSPLDKLLFSLMQQKKKFVMLSLSDRKVYVGKVISMGEPSETGGMDQDISLIPLMSGYRDEKNLKVDFVTFYDEVEGEFYLTIRQEMIVSATEFNFKAYNEWNKPPAQAEKEESEALPFWLK